MADVRPPRPPRRVRPLLAAGLSAAVLAVLAAGAQTPAPAPPGPKSQADVEANLRQQAAQKIALALPPTEAGAGVALTLVGELGQVLRDDLVFSGWFGMVDAQGENRLDPARLRDPKAWGAVGASYLVTTRITTQPGTAGKVDARLAVQLFETSGGAALFDKVWAGQWPEDLRRLAHVVADEIVKQLTGQPGIAQTRIAYVAKEGDGKEVFLMDYDGARVRKLTSTKTINLSPEWSPDGRRLVILSYVQRKPSIYLLDETGRVTTLRPKGGDLNSAPSFSPDGKTLAFTSDRDGNSEIYLMDVATGNETRITNHPAIETSPSWAPNGREIVFTSDRTGSPQLWLMSVDGGNARRLTFEGSYNESGAFSPDGTRIVFVSRLEGKFELVIHDLASGKETVISRGWRGNKEDPRWSPDGRRIVFAGDRDGTWAIYTVTDRGEDLRKLTRGSASYTPDWSPSRR